MEIQAFIDLGTNTFHCLLVELISKREYKVLHNKSVFVKIGSNGIKNNIISPEAIIRANKTIEQFRKIIDESKVQKVSLIATSAIRNASNNSQILKQLKNLGWEVSVIDGLREAELIYKGILLDKKLKLGQESFLTMDIGGGSVEFSIANSTQILWSRSFEIGAQRLKDKFHLSDPILDSEILGLKNFLTDELKDLFKVSESLKPVSLIGSSGTFDTLIEYQNIQRKKIDNQLDYSIFEAFYKKIINSTLAERIKIPAVHSERAEMLVVALILLDVVLQETQVKSIFVSNNALKEGLLYEALENLTP